MSGEKGSGERQARPAAWPEAGVLGSPATRGSGDRDRAGGAGLRGPCRVARSSRPRPLLLELPPPNLGSEKLSVASSSRRRCPAGRTRAAPPAEAAAPLRAGAADTESAVRAGCVRGESGVCGMDVESAGCARCVGWMQAECGVCRVDAGRVKMSAVCEVCAGVCRVRGGVRVECKVCGLCGARTRWMRGSRCV